MCETNGAEEVLSGAIDDYSTECQKKNIRVCDWTEQVLSARKPLDNFQ